MHSLGGEEEDSFHVSQEWFEKFKEQMSLQNVKRTGESASPYPLAHNKYPEHFKRIIEEKDYLPQQIFNLRETGLKFKHEVEASVAPYKMYIQKKAKQSEITFLLHSL
jgi:hypothetical protein